MDLYFIRPLLILVFLHTASSFSSSFFFTILQIEHSEPFLSAQKPTDFKILSRSLTYCAHTLPMLSLVACPLLVTQGNIHKRFRWYIKRKSSVLSVFSPVSEYFQWKSLYDDETDCLLIPHSPHQWIHYLFPQSLNLFSAFTYSICCCSYSSSSSSISPSSTVLLSSNPHHRLTGKSTDCSSFSSRSYWTS